MKSKQRLDYESKVNDLELISEEFERMLDDYDVYYECPHCNQFFFKLPLFEEHVEECKLY